MVLSLSFQYVLYKHAYLLRDTPEVSRALFIWDNISGSIIMFLDSSVLPLNPGSHILGLHNFLFGSFHDS